MPFWALGCLGTVVIGIGVVSCTLNVSYGADASGPAIARLFNDTDADAIQDVLYLTPRQPLLIRLHLTVNGEGFRALRRRWADAVFTRLDRDQNGNLEGEEAKSLPAVTCFRAPLDASAILPADSAPADGKISRDECLRYLLTVTGTSFSILTVDSPSAGQLGNGQNPQVNLFPKLDSNHDGKLSKQEMESAAVNLKRFDKNEDDLVDNSELQQSLPDELIASRQQLTDTLSVLHVVDPFDSGMKLSRRLLESYDKASRDPAAKLFRKDERLSPTELIIENDVFQQVDLDRDGKLDRRELERLPSVMTPCLELEIQSPAKNGTFSITPIPAVTPSHTAAIDIQPASDGKWLLKMNEATFALRVEPSDTSCEPVLRSNYAKRFMTMDMNKNDYLEPEELRRFGFANTFFSQADSDGNGKLFEREYLEHLEREIELSKSGFLMEVSADGPSLFRLIDVNPPFGRLSLRELSDAFIRLKELDANNDDQLTLTELSIELKAVFKLGTPRVNGPLRMNSMGPATQRVNVTGVTVSERVKGKTPSWFLKMDRNLDGDLSPNEFLGRRVLFDQIDLNRDGLISQDEASTAHREAANSNRDREFKAP
ncbi:hypothetical protein [Schlesneria paludicola]|uniref:hypothetical protein n=1 Tax=Schlesneria paludicola TaxID=360056 RepID=UPI00138AD6D8|nr:hypothetical protein [Schlesneria paludicola]